MIYRCSEKMGSTTKAAERKVIIELTGLLKKNSDKLLSGETNLCLTTSSLSILAVNFRRFSENAGEVEASGNNRSKSKKKDEIDIKTWQENIRTLIDFVWKVKALKIIHGSYTMKAPIHIHRFRSLQVLEVKRVPIHMVEGLSKLRGQLKEITVSKSLQTVKDLLEICGGDRTPGLVWPHLKTAYLSFNTLQELDMSLRYVPFIEVIDFSHNSINKTGDCLQNLFDLKRVNFGYNMLKSVPKFSSENILKIKTLVLRNNSLESLDGIEELIGLEELDVSENFLLDHRVLQGLMSLKRLQVLCLLGNPLSYKTDHRNLTLQYIYPQTGLGVFLLDGKRLTQHEQTVLQENQYRSIYDQEAPSVSDGTGTPGLSEPDSNIAVSQLSPHGSKKKHGHKRKRSKGRLPNIVDITDSMEEEYLARSSGNSPSTSYADDSELEAQRLEDEKYYERMRAHYKDDWLLVQRNQTDGAPEDVPDTAQKNGEKTVTEKDTSKEKNGKVVNLDITNAKNGKTEIQETQKSVVEEVIQPEVNRRVTSPTTSESMSQGTVQSPTSPEGFQIGENTDIYSLQSKKSGRRSGEKDSRRIFGMYSVDAQDAPTSPKEDDSQQYGAECEPFIMMLPDDDMKQLIVTVNQRFIIEKDLSGNKIAALDLKSLKRIGRTEEKCYGSDIIGGFVFTILRLDFDYVRKDMRQRRYAVESDEEAARFESLASLHIKSDKVEKDQMQCLKCRHEFEADSQDLADLVKCPKCASKMTIKSDKVKVSLTEEKKFQEKPAVVERRRENKSNIWRQSTIRRSRREHVVVEDEGFDEIDSGKVDNTDVSEKSSLADRYSLGSSLKECADQLIPDVQADVTATGNTQVAAETKEEQTAMFMSEQTSNQSMPETSSLRKNSSLSDVLKSGASISGPRDSVSSVESDITVLAANSSRGSIAVISESSNEIIKTSTSDSQQNTLPSDVCGDTGHVTSGRNVETGISLTKDGQGQLTPVGSPLTNSVCSSMVSSVYENTLAGSGEDTTSMDDGIKVIDASTDQDDIAVSVPVRRSKTGRKDRRSKNRNFTMYDQDINVEQFDSNVSVTVDDTVNKSSSREASIYDTPEASETDNTKFEEALESSGPSIYDTAVSDDSLETSHSESVDLLSHNSRRSHDDSSTNQSMSGYSPPLRRKGSSRSRSRSRSRSKNRSAIYLDDSEVYKTEDKNNSANIPEFPSDLSPIKRTGSSRRSVKNRSALFIENSSEISDIDSQSSGVSPKIAQDVHETDEVCEKGHESSSSVQLPWEQSGDQSHEKSGRDDSLNHDEFVNIDHNIKLHLELQVFKAEETAQCAIQCDIVQYMKPEAMKSLLVISTHRIIIFRIDGESAASPDWLKSYEDQPITELRYIDIGLGYQTLRLEFETECSSYTLLISDEGRCKKFLTLLSDIVAHSDHGHLEGIGKSNPTTLENLDIQVLTTEDDTVPQELVRFLTVKYSDTNTSSDDMDRRSLVITPTDLVLVEENHQWPLPRLQAPLTGAIKGRQFTVVQREKINNIGTLSFNEFKHTELRLDFLESSAVGNASEWIITFETNKGVKSFVDSIRGPWEEEFGVSLDITSTSFTDTEKSSLTE